MVVLVIWAFLVFPLNLAGTLIGRNWGSAVSFPTRGKLVVKF